MPAKKIIEISATLMLQTILLSFVISSMCLIIDMPVNKYSLLFGLIVSISICKIFAGDNWSSIITSATVVIVVCSILFFISSFIYDYSWDGNWYHSHMIWELAHGWNPLYDGPIPEGEQFFDVLWANHYQKGYELLCSNIVCITGNISSGKSVNILLPLLSVFFVHKCLNYVKKGLWFNSCISIIVSLNPIVVNQMLVHYNDWSGYTCIILILSNIYLWQKSNKLVYYINALLVLSFVMTIKYNITFYSITILLVILLLFFSEIMTRWKYVVSGVIVAILSLLFFGGATLIDNTIKKGQPLYPLYGEKTVDIMTHNTPLQYLDKSNFYRVSHSLLSNPNSNDKIDLISPFVIDGYSIKSSSSYDSRIGGWGIFFFEATLLLVICFIVIVFKSVHVHMDRIQMKVILVLLLCCSLLFILPCGWWARYHPYIYIIPVSLIIYFYLSGTISKWILSVPIILLFLNIFVSIPGIIYRSFSGTGVINFIIRNNEKKTSPLELCTTNYLLVHMLRNKNVDVKFSSLEKCRWKLPLSPFVYFSEPLNITEKEEREDRVNSILIEE